MGKKGTKRKTRWRVLPIGEDGGSGSGNEEEPDCDQSGAGATGSYARATQHRPIRRPNNNNRNPGGGGGYYNKQQHYHNNSRSYHNHDNNHQPLVTTEKHIFNEEEYTKITTPRQDVLFKKGYLGRKRPTVPAESSDQTTSADVVNGNAAHFDPSSGHNEGLDNDPNEILEEQPQFIYTNGFVDQSGVFYINGSGYEIFDPYSGQVTVVVGPHYGPNGGPPVLAAVPCQPVPLQPLEWFNPPGFLPYVTAPGPPLGVPRDRRKRYSTDSQNCSPQSSESTGPPGSPQESDEVALTGGPEGAMYPPHHPPPPPPYVYPGYMFGAPMYNMNGVTVQSTPNAAPSSDVGGKRRKKKRRRRRRRNGVEDGSEESSSEDKDAEEEPMSLTSQESSLESDSKLSSPGENPRAPPARTNAHTQTAVEASREVALEPPPPDVADIRDAATDTVDIPAALVNGVDATHAETNGLSDSSHRTVVVNGGGRLVNGHEAKPKGERKAEKKGKNKLNGLLTNGISEKLVEVPVKQIEDIEEFAFQDDSFLYSQEYVNGNVKVDLDEESEWITVKGHKRSNEERRIPPELTNGHAKFSNKSNNGAVSGGKDRIHNKFPKTDKNVVRVEERCTYAKVKPSEASGGNRDRVQLNGRARLVNGSRMDEAPPGDVEPVQEVEEVAPNKPSRKERRSQKNGASPPKTPEVAASLTATARPFEMPSMSLRPEAVARRADAAPPKLSKEDTLLAALTVSAKDEAARHAGVATTRDARKQGDASKKTNGNGEKKKKTTTTPDAPKVTPVKDLSTSKSAEKEEPVAAKQVSQELIEQERLAEGDFPPVPPPRRKKWHPSNKRAPTPGRAESTDESSSSSSQESEESVIECLSSGFNSPRVKVPSGFSSSDDDDVIYQGVAEEQDPKALGRISESLEESANNGNGKQQSNASKPVPTETTTKPNKPVPKEVPKPPVPQISVDTVETSDAKNEEHLKNVRKIAQEIVDSIIQEALTESVRLQIRKENDSVKLGITDAVTRWLRSQSPDVLSVPRNDDSEEDLSDDAEADADENTPTGPKNLKSNPLPAPSVEIVNSQSNASESIGDKDGAGRRVANTTSEKKRDSRNEEEDAISSSSVSCGEWDPWDCHHTIPQHDDDDTPNKSRLDGYDPLANDTFSPIESTLLSDAPGSMCDPTPSVARYYVLGPSALEDLECSDSDVGTPPQSADAYHVSLAEELARLQQPLPESWAVEPLRVTERCTACRCHVHEPGDSGVESGDEGVVTRKREGMSVFKRRLVGRLKGEGAPFPYGGICCILQ